MYVERYRMYSIIMKFSNNPEYIGTFFNRNNNLAENYIDYTFRLIGNQGSTKDLKIKINTRRALEIYSIDDDNDKELSHNYIDNSKRKELIERVELIDKNNQIIYIAHNNFNNGGSKASVKKVVCGKLRCIYKIHGSRKEHLKYKGQLMPVAEYKKIMKGK
jgi:hypothetical protein